MRKTFTRFLKGAICLYCTLLLFGQADAQKLSPRYVSVDNNCPGYYEWLPAGYGTPGKKFPLLIMFSGNGDLGNGDSTELQYVLRNGPGQLITSGQWPDSFTVNKKTFRFIVIMPQYQNVPVLTDLDSIVNYSLRHYNVDTGRVYLTGLSDGGNNAWWYPCGSLDRAYKIAAILPISAGQLWGGANYLAQANVAIFATANRGDSLVPCTNTINNIALVNSQTPPPNPLALDTIWNANGHDAWTETYDLHKNLHNGMNCFQWMLQYSRDPGDTVPRQPPPPPTVTLSSYTATLTSNQKEATVAWTSSVERGNKYFIVQRSTDSTHFTNLDTTASTALQGAGASYSYTDPSPFAGNDYYRLVGVDTIGNSTFFAVLKVKVPSTAPPPPPPPSVTLTAYSATLTTNNKAVDVDWITAREVGNKYFVVQRSADSVNFINLGVVNSTAKSGQGSSYRFTDNSPLAGNDYYRLESVDSTGKDSLYPVLLVVVPTPPPPPPVVLPVTLTLYTATLESNNTKVDVDWTTALEQGNKGFVVLRSTDSVNFASLDSIPSQAPTGGGYAYVFVDSKPFAGNNYYRVESIDINGHDSLYAILKVVVGSTSTTPPPSGPPLPVALTVYTATGIKNNRAVNVIWTTASEQGNKDFIVQRSTDSINFIDIDTVAAAGTPDSGASYVYTDNGPVPGNDYYRLQRFDIDGHDTLYRVLMVPTGGRWDSLEPSPGILQLSPNPSTGLIYLHLVDSTRGAIQVSITDMDGQVLRIWEFRKPGMLWDQSVDVSGLPRGCYALQIRGTKTRYVQSILKE
ncbi:MAG TPA: T9SS type A sorting domain-containing protein [Puia sp.]|nr:T9SS type A sorting domain-containing protein [Puia sp.]